MTTTIELPNEPRMNMNTGEQNTFFTKRNASTGQGVASSERFLAGGEFAPIV
jgi:hypothetical protein